MLSRVPFFLLLALLVPGALFAGEKPRKGSPSDAPIIDITPFYYSGTRVTIDGGVNDWEGIDEVEIKTLTSGEYEYDWTGPKDLSATLKAQHNDSQLYFYLKVNDNKFVAPSRKQGGDLVDIYFYLGELASKKNRYWRLRIDPTYILTEQTPTVDWEEPKKKRGEATEVQVAGYPLEKGYDLELAIPFSAFGETAPIYEPLGYCVIIRDWDHDDENEDEASLSSCPFNFKKKKKRSPDDFGKILWGTRDRILKGIEKNLNDVKISEIDPLKGQLGGDKNREEVFVAAGNLVVMGVNIGPGEWYSYNLGLQEGDQVSSLELADVTGDGLDEILITTRVLSDFSGTQVGQEILWVHPFEDGIGDPILAIEVSNFVEGEADQIASKVSIGKKKISVTRGKAEGWTEDTYIDVDNGFHDDYEPLLLPWEKPKKKTYSYRDGEFSK